MYRTYHTRKVVTSWALTAVLTMGLAFGIVSTTRGVHHVSSAVASTSSAVAASTVASPSVSTTKTMVTGFYDDGHFVSVSGSQQSGGDF